MDIIHYIKNRNKIFYCSYKIRVSKKWNFHFFIFSIFSYFFSFFWSWASFFFHFFFIFWARPSFSPTFVIFKRFWIFALFVEVWDFRYTFLYFVVFLEVGCYLSSKWMCCRSCRRSRRSSLMGGQSSERMGRKRLWKSHQVNDTKVWVRRKVQRWGETAEKRGSRDWKR